MKTVPSIISALLMLILPACAQLKHLEQGSSSANAVDNTSPLPTGTYFIVNAANALTPVGPTAGQNVFLQPFTNSGTQKWDITQHKTTKGITYTIRLAGSDNLYFQPYAVKDHTPIIGSNSSGTTFRITAAPGPKSWYIKSGFYNGDALRSFVFSPNLPTEIRFEAAENTDKFLWKLVPADGNK
jgi:hypothetical protein